MSMRTHIYNKFFILSVFIHNGNEINLRDGKVMVAQNLTLKLV